MMRQTYRKLLGTLFIVILAVMYALVATTIATAKLAESSGVVHFFYFLISGLLWVLPSMLIIKWMLVPDPPQD